MMNPLENTKEAIELRMGKVAHRTTQALNSEIEEIIYKAIANEDVEAMVTRAIERVILSLLYRYRWLLAIAFLIVMGIQSFVLGLLLKVSIG